MLGTPVLGRQRQEVNPRPLEETLASKKKKQVVPEEEHSRQTSSLPCMHSHGHVCVCTMCMHVTERFTVNKPGRTSSKTML